MLYIPLVFIGILIVALVCNYFILKPQKEEDFSGFDLERKMTVINISPIQVLVVVAAVLVFMILMVSAIAIYNTYYFSQGPM